MRWIASAARSAALAKVLSSRADVAYVSVEGGKHAMLRHHDAFDGLAADFAAWSLLGIERDGVIEQLARGRRLVTV